MSSTTFEISLFGQWQWDWSIFSNSMPWLWYEHSPLEKENCIDINADLMSKQPFGFETKWKYIMHSTKNNNKMVKHIILLLLTPGECIDKWPRLMFYIKYTQLKSSLTFSSHQATAAAIHFDRVYFLFCEWQCVPAQLVDWLYKLTIFRVRSM